MIVAICSIQVNPRFCKSEVIAYYLKIITVYDPNSDLLSRLKETAKPLQYQVYVDKQRVYTYFGREITDFKVALLAAFEIADTPEKIMKSPGERKPRQKGKTI